MAVAVTIDQSTIDFIAKKGSHLIVKTIKAAGCCGGGPIELTTEFGKPDEPLFFDEVSLKNITIYVQKGINAKDNQITLKLSGFGMFKFVTALGISRF